MNMSLTNQDQVIKKSLIYYEDIVSKVWTCNNLYMNKLIPKPWVRHEQVMKKNYNIWTSCEKVWNQSWEGNEHVLSKSSRSHEKAMNKAWPSHKHVKIKLWGNHKMVLKKSLTSYEQVINKSWTSHEEI